MRKTLCAAVLIAIAAIALSISGPATAGAAAGCPGSLIESPKASPWAERRSVS